MEEILVPLLLTGALRTVQGRTRFQKLVFLIQKRAITKKVPSSKYQFELYHYGPFSAELSDQLDHLVSIGYLGVTPETTPSGYTRYSYYLTNSGRSVLATLKERRLVEPDLEKIIGSVSEKYGGMSLPRLVRVAYRNL